MKVVLTLGLSYSYDGIKAVNGVPVEVTAEQGEYLVSTGQFAKADEPVAEAPAAETPAKTTRKRSSK